NAVKRFQSMYGLPADGIYGPKTKARLGEMLKRE
ncbi:peptidoglycan-binding domain-containing protein, partial [Burkholderia sp. SIMBA_024]